jgi:hypothetical protein
MSATILRTFVFSALSLFFLAYAISASAYPLLNSGAGIQTEPIVAGAKIFTGYDVDLQVALSSLTRGPAQSTKTNSSNVSYGLDTLFTSDDYLRSEQISISASYSGIGGGGSASFFSSDRFRFSTSRAYLIITENVLQSVETLNNDAKIDATLVHEADVDPVNFYKTFGTGYVTQVNYGGSLYVRFAIDKMESETDHDFQASVSGGGGGFSGSAQDISHLKELTRQRSVSIDYLQVGGDAAVGGSTGTYSSIDEFATRIGTFAGEVARGGANAPSLSVGYQSFSTSPDLSLHAKDSIKGVSQQIKLWLYALMKLQIELQSTRDTMEAVDKALQGDTRQFLYRDLLNYVDLQIEKLKTTGGDALRDKAAQNRVATASLVVTSYAKYAGIDSDSSKRLHFNLDSCTFTLDSSIRNFQSCMMADYYTGLSNIRLQPPVLPPLAVSTVHQYWSTVPYSRLDLPFFIGRFGIADHTPEATQLSLFQAAVLKTGGPCANYTQAYTQDLWHVDGGGLALEAICVRLANPNPPLVPTALFLTAAEKARLRRVMEAK